MRKTELDEILIAMLESHSGISDIIFSVGRPLQVESFGELKPVFREPQIDALTSYQTERIALNIIGDDRRLLKEYLLLGSCDCSYSIGERIRFRVNIFRQRGNFAVVMRKAQTEIPSLMSLGLPPIFKEMAREKNGLILVTGATGTGKTTTLSALLNEVNETQAVHVVTLEDPIEYVHTHKKATFNQRELGQDFEDFPSGLRAAMRQAPKIILVGEMRDRRTVEIALTAAETGHLVLSTLHTVDAGQTINRILGMFELAEESQLRLRLADSLRYVVSQRLAPKVGGGRTLLMEIMGSNLRTRETISGGENETRAFYDIIEDSHTFGWVTFDQAIGKAYEDGIVTEETAELFASRKGKVRRAIDNVKKAKGIVTDSTTDMRLDIMNPKKR